MVKAALLGTTAGTPIEIWFQDEARVGQQGTLEHVWAPIGSRPAMVRDNRHDSAYLYGAICPARGPRLRTTLCTHVMSATHQAQKNRLPDAARVRFAACWQPENGSRDGMVAWIIWGS